MKKYFFILLTITATFLSGCSQGQNANSETNLAAVDFANKINEMPAAPVVDVRTPDEFSKGHLKNARNIDWNGNDFEAKIAALDKSKPVFVYCLSGGRSSSAAKQMRNEGFKEVYELNGGIMKWRGANLPEEVAANASAGMKKQQFDDLLKSDKMVLIDFYATWCEPCKKMKPYLDEIGKERSDSVTVVRINADDNQALCKELKIDALPVLQLYKAGQLKWTHTGFVAKDTVFAQLQ